MCWCIAALQAYRYTGAEQPAVHDTLLQGQGRGPEESQGPQEQGQHGLGRGLLEEVLIPRPPPLQCPVDLQLLGGSLGLGLMLLAASQLSRSRGCSRRYGQAVQ